jgi:hypothetical protein
MANLFAETAMGASLAMAVVYGMGGELVIGR